MAKSDFFENAFLGLTFLGQGIANIADDAGTGPLSDLYYSLHTASPGEAGDQSTNEISTANYTNYARVAVPRSASGWALAGDTVTQVNDAVFAPALAGDSGTITHWALGTDPSGAGRVLYHGALSVSITLAEALEPKLKAGSTITES